MAISHDIIPWNKRCVIDVLDKILQIGARNISIDSIDVKKIILFEVKHIMV